MLALLKAEWIQLRTTRTALIWGIVLVILGALLPLALLLYVGTGPNVERIEFEEVTRIRNLNFLLMVFSLVAISGSYRHRVAVTERLIAPTIWQSLLAKLITFGLFGAGVVFLQMAFVTLLLMVWPGISINISMSAVQPAALAVAAGALSSMLGVACARLIRNQIATVLATIGYFVFFEPSLVAALSLINKTIHDLVTPYFPGISYSAFMGMRPGSEIIGGATLLVWIALIAGISYLLDRKRD